MSGATVFFLFVFFIIGMTMLVLCAIVFSARMSDHEEIDVNGRDKASPRGQTFVEKAERPKGAL